MTCTWENCQRPAEHPRANARGKVWARLCTLHNGMLDAAEHDSKNVAGILEAWRLAKGGRPLVD